MRRTAAEFGKGDSSQSLLLLRLLKRLPVDLGQGNLRAVTKGKLIGRSLVPDADDGQTALDVGCREGIQTKWLDMKGYRVTSIDIRPVYPNALVVDVDKPLPFNTNSFDLVWCSEVIEHLRNPAMSVQEMLRVLKPGGMLVVTAPNSRCWFYRALSLVGIAPSKAQNPDHKQFFSEADIRALVRGGKVYGYFPYVILKFTITRWLDFLTPTFVVAQRKTDPAR